MYYYFEHNINVLPLAKDGHLDYGLLQSMKALDLFKVDGDAYKEQFGKKDEDAEDGVVEF